MKSKIPSMGTIKRLVNELAETLSVIPLEGQGDNRAVAVQLVLPAAALDKLQAIAKQHGYFSANVGIYLADRLVQLSSPEVDALLAEPVNWRTQPREPAPKDESPEAAAHAAIEQSARARASERQRKRASAAGLVLLEGAR